MATDMHSPPQTVNAPQPSPSPARAQLSNRLASIDAFRGLVMFLMMAEVLEFAQVSKALPESGFWKFLTYHQSHVAWIGCSLHDLIQPSFSLLVGVALPFSLARRAKEGQSELRRTLHAFWRAAVLVLLGVFLRSIGHQETYWTFEDTLSQIGLGYGFLYLLANRSRVVQWAALGVILVGYWAAFALYPLPVDDPQTVLSPPAKPAGASPAALQEYDRKVRASEEAVATHPPGFAAHWGKNDNLASAFDTWLLNLFPRSDDMPGGGKHFVGNPGGYVTLSFIPTLGTMIIGLLAGGVLLSGRPPWGKVRWLAVSGIVFLAAGWLLGELGICPVVKRIWTPSWVLFSGGWCLLLMACFYTVIDLWGAKRWAFVLVLIGMNSIAAYLIAHLFPGFIRAALPRHLGAGLFSAFGDAYEHLLLGAGVLMVEGLILSWMYRRKIFLRI